MPRSERGRVDSAGGGSIATARAARSRAFTTAHGEGADSVNCGRQVEITREGRRAPGRCDGARVAGMIYQPAVLRDGTLLGVFAANLGCSPRPGATGIHRFAGRFSDARHLAGAIVAETGGDPYSGARGLAAPSACAPAALPDGRIAFAYDPGARGDLGLYVMRHDGTAIERLVIPATLRSGSGCTGSARVAAVRLRDRTSDSSSLLHAALSAWPKKSLIVRYLNRKRVRELPLEHGSRPAPRRRPARAYGLAALARRGREGGDSIAWSRGSTRTRWVVDERLPRTVPRSNKGMPWPRPALGTRRLPRAGFNAGARGNSRWHRLSTGHCPDRGRRSRPRIVQRRPRSVVSRSSTRPGSSLGWRGSARPRPGSEVAGWRRPRARLDLGWRRRSRCGRSLVWRRREPGPVDYDLRCCWPPEVVRHSAAHTIRHTDSPRYVMADEIESSSQQKEPGQGDVAHAGGRRRLRENEVLAPLPVGEGRKRTSSSLGLDFHHRSATQVTAALRISIAVIGPCSLGALSFSQEECHPNYPS